jgi:hypothetical protein
MSHGLCRWAPRSLLALPQLKKASDGQDSAGFGRVCRWDGLGSGVQLSGYWEKLTTTLDSLERFGWLSHARQRHLSPLFLPWRNRRGAGGQQGPGATTTGQRAHPCRRACECLQRCPGLSRSAPLLRVRAGMQRLQQKHGLERLLA